MKKSKFISTLAIAAMVGVLGAAGVAGAYPGDDGPGRHRGGPYAGMTDEQRDEMRQIHEEHYKKMAPLHQQMMAKRAELDALYYGKSKDNGKIQALHREMADIQARMFSARAELRDQLEAKGIFEPGLGGGCGMMRGHGGPGWHGGPDGFDGKHRGGMRHGGPDGRGHGGHYR